MVAGVQHATAAINADPNYAAAHARDFRIRIVDAPAAFYREFAEDIVARIRTAGEEGRRFVGIFPVGPMPQYGLAARLINEERLSCRHVHSFNMDEYANENGETTGPSVLLEALIGGLGALIILLLAALAYWRMG